MDIDDLLKQMYDNLDSQCLFDMPTAELEKIWGVRIFDFVEFHNTAVNNLTPEQLEIYNLKFNQVIEDRGQHFNNNNAIYLEKMVAVILRPVQKTILKSFGFKFTPHQHIAKHIANTHGFQAAWIWGNFRNICQSQVKLFYRNILG